TTSRTTARGRSASSSSPRTKRATRSSGTRPTSAASSTATCSRARTRESTRNGGHEGQAQSGGRSRMIRPDFETITYDEGDDGVAVVTLNRPDVHNAFNSLMQRELHTLWRALRRRDEVRCIVLTGAGEKAFC